MRAFLQAGLILIVLVQLAPAAVATVPLPGAAEESKKSANEIPPDYASPRDTLQTFLDNMRILEADKKNQGAWDNVFITLELPSAIGNLRKDAAWKLHHVINALEFRDPLSAAWDRSKVDQEKIVSFEYFPAHPSEQVRKAIQPIIRELGKPPSSIVFVKTSAGAWKFSGETLSNINRLYNWSETRAVTGERSRGAPGMSSALRQYVPADFKNRYFAGLELWQWIGLFVVIFLAVVIDHVGRLFVRPVLRRVVRHAAVEPDPDRLRVAVRPIGLLIGAISFLLLVNLLGLAGMALTIVVVVARLLVIVGASWAAWSGLDLFSDALIAKSKSTGTGFDHTVIPLVRKSIKLFIVAIAVIYIADSLDIALAPLLASFGLAGLAISFAAQDTIKNLFGGITVYLDKPFKAGERIFYGQYDGVVEQVGFRSTKIRLLNGHVLTVPNANLTNEPVENPARRPFVRRILNVTITYDTPREKIEQAVAIIKNILAEEGIRERIHPVINGDEFPPRAYFNDYNADSLNILVIYWFAPPVWWDYLEHAERFNLRLFEEFERAGIDFAFPTQTLHLAGDAKRELTLRLLRDESQAVSS